MDFDIIILDPRPEAKGPGGTERSGLTMRGYLDLQYHPLYTEKLSVLAEVFAPFMMTTVLEVVR